MRPSDFAFWYNASSDSPLPPSGTSAGDAELIGACSSVQKMMRATAKQTLARTPSRPQSAVLTRRLSALVDAGLLERRRYSERPPHYEYVLTDTGRDFRPVLVAMLAWGNRHFAPEGASVLLIDKKRLKERQIPCWSIGGAEERSTSATFCLPPALPPASAPAAATHRSIKRNQSAGSAHRNECAAENERPRDYRSTAGQVGRIALPR